MSEVLDFPVKITSADWMPLEEETGNYPADFVAWIDSINSGFKNRKSYRRFELYCEQADRWLAEKKYFSNFSTDQERHDFAVSEFLRIRENSLYFLDKYVFFKTGSKNNKYISDAAQRIVAYLVDAGYCLIIGKGRQIWFSTTIGAIAIKRINFNKGYFVKFLAENANKAQEIFDDKIKFPFYKMEDWMKSSVQNDQDNFMKLAFKQKGRDKGKVTGADSKLMVEAPYATAINGGAPDLVLIDEIGQIKLISDIVGEGRPTLYGKHPVTGKLYRQRQIVMWGTGGKMERGGSEMEVEYSQAMEQWAQRDFEYGIVPVFFDYWARSGMTQAHYDREKRIAYRTGMEDKKVMFHQHYPATIADMFLSSADTVIPIAKINSSIQRIYSMKDKPINGHFQPNYDTTKPLTGFVPFKIQSVTFVPSGDGTAPVTIMPGGYPEDNWINRYYQGTDPINSQSGHSFMSSAIWDQLKHNVPCVLNARSHDYRNEYLQAHLMNIFYGRPPHLIEINVGRELVNFIDELGGMRSLMAQSMLSESLRVNSSEVIGIKKMASNTPFIHNRLVELLESYCDNINVEAFLMQLKKFVKKDLKDGKGTKFDVVDYRYAKSDVIYGILYSWIAAQSYSHREPRNMEDKEKKRKVRRLVCNASTGYTNTMQEVWI